MSWYTKTIVIEYRNICFYFIIFTFILILPLILLAIQTYTFNFEVLATGMSKSKRGTSTLFIMTLYSAVNMTLYVTR